jgi:pyruvate carboxylase subunit B
LANQLKEQNALDRIRDVFAEIPRVREDLGYPPLVTPTSQIVGTQAVYNVLAGERYKTITNEVKRYLQGGYGQAPAPVNADLQKKAVGNEEIIETRPADALKPELDKLRQDIGELAQSEEDVLTFAMFPDLGREFLQQRAEGTLKAEPLLAPSNGQTTSKEAMATEFKVDVHGESYDIAITGVGDVGGGKRKFYVSIDGMPEEVTFEALNEYVSEGGGGARKKASEPGHATAPLPGNVVEVLVAEGDQVEAGQALLVMEAMKMETELLANIAGTVKALHVAKGDRVTPGETLIEIG